MIIFVYILLVFTHLNTKCVKTRSKQKECLPFNQGYQTIVFIYYREQLFLFSISVFCKYRTSGEYVTHHLWFYLLLRRKKRVLGWKKVLYFFKCLYFTFYLNFKPFLAKKKFALSFNKQTFNKQVKHLVSTLGI